MAGWLSRSDAESCKCCKCCKFRPDHNLSAKIWALYWKPKTTLSLVFSVKIVWWFDWIFWQMHRNSQLCQATPYCFMINVMLLCNNIYSINSVTAIIITSCLLWSSVFSYLCFTCLGQKLDNWKYTTRAPRFTAKSRRIMVQLFYDQNQTLQPVAPKLIKRLPKKNLFSWTLCL